MEVSDVLRVVELDPVGFAVQSRLSRLAALESMRWREDVDFLTRDMLLRLEAVVYGEVKEARSRLAVRVPASWWQHFKAEAIKWGNPFFDPSKVRYVERVAEVVDRDLVWWPEADLPVPGGWGRPVRVALAGESRFAEGV